MSQTPLNVIDKYLLIREAPDAFGEEIIKALDDAGFVIVPKEPTAEMIEAGDDTDHTIEAMSEHPDYEEQIANIYRAMIAAGLKPPSMIAEG